MQFIFPARQTIRLTHQAFSRQGIKNRLLTRYGMHLAKSASPGFRRPSLTFSKSDTTRFQVPQLHSGFPHDRELPQSGRLFSLL